MTASCRSRASWWFVRGHIVLKHVQILNMKHVKILNMYYPSFLITVFLFHARNVWLAVIVINPNLIFCHHSRKSFFFVLTNYRKEFTPACSLFACQQTKNHACRHFLSLSWYQIKFYKPFFRSVLLNKLSIVVVQSLSIIFKIIFAFPSLRSKNGLQDLGKLATFVQPNVNTGFSSKHTKEGSINKALVSSHYVFL